MSRGSASISCLERFGSSIWSGAVTGRNNEETLVDMTQNRKLLCLLGLVLGDHRPLEFP